ncbi:MAG: hypothetical protein AABY89_01995, partial [Acidobacteriota bacterium]
MNEDARRVHAAEDFLRRFAGGLKALQLYSSDHPIVARSMDQFIDSLERLHVDTPSVIIGLVEGQVVVDGLPVSSGPGVGETIERFRSVGIE